MISTTYAVRLWGVRTVNGKKGKAFRVRWTLEGRDRSKSFATAKLAESFRAKLVTATREGIPFDLASGLPVTMAPRPAATGPTWLEHAQDFIDARWSESSPRHRKSTAEGLVTITAALTTDGRQPPAPQTMRRALMHWAFNSGARQRASAVPHEYSDAMAWIAANSRPLRDLAEPAVVREVLAAISVNLSGRPAAASTANRKRAALSAALGYAVELGHFDVNPLTRVKIRRRQVTEAVDGRVVVNPEQARALLATIGRRWPALHAYFACLYYAALRPSEARNLRAVDLRLPADGWGEILLSGSYQDSGARWTDDGSPAEERQLNHRAERATRRVPAPRPLVSALRGHLDEFGTGAEGRLFVTRTGKLGRPVAQPFVRPIGSSSTARVLHLARAEVFSEAQQATPLAQRPYDLRHACVSTWLSAGVPPTQVAAWAGHSVAVLLRVYAHAVDGQAQAARQRIEEALAGAGAMDKHQHRRFARKCGRIEDKRAG